MNRATVPVDSTNCTDMHVTEVAEEERKTGQKEIRSKGQNFHEFGEKKSTYSFKKLCKPQPGRIQRKPHLGNVLVRLLKTKDKEKILQAPREEQNITYTGTRILLTPNFSSETMEDRKPGTNSF